MELQQEPDAWDLSAAEPDLLSRDWRHVPPEETSLDGNDNVLLGGLAHRRADPQVWMQNVRQYFRAVFRLIDDHLQQSTAAADITLRLNPHYNLRSFETYWEFQSDDAVHDVSRMEDVLAGCGRRYQWGRHSATDVRGALAGESISYRVSLNAYTEISVYAKTDKRIRFEVRHDLTRGSQLTGGSHTTAHFDDMFSWFHILSSYAADALNEILPNLASATRVAVEVPSSYDLVQALLRRAPNVPTFSLLFSLLANQRRVLASQHPDWQRYLSELIEDGVLLQPRRGLRVFTISPRYAPALRALRHRSDGPQVDEAVVDPE